MVKKGKLTHITQVRLAALLALTAVLLACGSCSTSSGGYAITPYTGGSTTGPTARITYTVSDVEDSLEVNFSASDSTDDGTIVRYDWDFDSDGNYDEEDGGVTTSFTYSAAGTYQATVRVTDDDNMTDTAQTTSFTVPLENEAPTAVFTYAQDSTNRLIVNFNAGASTDNDGTITQYEWDWENDGTYDDTVNEATTTHTYSAYDTYTVGLRVTDNDGDTGTATLAVEVSETGNAAPVAVIVTNPEIVIVGEPVTLDASGSTDSDGTIVSYEWDLNNDGTFEQNTGTTPTFGPFNLTDSDEHKYVVQVTDDDGATATAAAYVTAVTSADLTAVINADPVSGAAPLVVSFDAAGCYGGGEITDYEWDFDGDGEYNEAGTDEETYHGNAGPFNITYDTVGDYSPALKITDDQAATSVDSVDIEVLVPTYSVTVSITVSGNDNYELTSDTLVQLYIGDPEDGGSPVDQNNFDTSEAADGATEVYTFTGRDAGTDYYLWVKNICVEWEGGPAHGEELTTDLIHGPFTLPPDYTITFTGDQYTEPEGPSS